MTNANKRTATPLNAAPSDQRRLQPAQALVSRTSTPLSERVLPNLHAQISFKDPKDFEFFMRAIKRGSQPDCGIEAAIEIEIPVEELRCIEQFRPEIIDRLLNAGTRNNRIDALGRATHAIMPVLDAVTKGLKLNNLKTAQKWVVQSYDAQLKDQKGKRWIGFRGTCAPIEKMETPIMSVVCHEVKNGAVLNCVAEYLDPKEYIKN